MFNVQEYKYKNYVLVQSIIIIIFTLINNFHNILHIIEKDYHSPGLLVFNILQLMLLLSYFFRKKNYRKTAEHLFFLSLVSCLIALNVFEQNIFYKNNMIIAYPIMLSLIFTKKRHTIIYGSIIILSSVFFQIIYKFYTVEEFITMIFTLTVLVLTAFIYKLFVTKLEYLQENTASEIFNSSLLILGRVAELKDKETRSHLERVGIIVEMLLQRLKKKSSHSNQITDEYIRDTAQASILHDIGKIAIDDSILMKRDKLTESEFNEMKKHTTAGENLLKEVQESISSKKIFNLAVEIARDHHEWWNGKGYPNNLKKREIPLSARVMAVADVFDALISERPYKRAYSPKEAYIIIVSESGTHFDPEIVKCFTKIYNKLYEKIKLYL